MEDNQASGLFKNVGETLAFKYDNGVLELDIESADQSGAMLFSKDGTLPSIPNFNIADAKPITQESDLIGTWNIVGAYADGAIIYGSTEDITDTIMKGQDMTMVFEAGGKCSLGGSEATYTVGADGASVTQASLTFKLTSLDGCLLVDYGSIMSSDMALVYKK